MSEQEQQQARLGKAIQQLKEFGLHHHADTDSGNPDDAYSAGGVSADIHTAKKILIGLLPCGGDSEVVKRPWERMNPVESMDGDQVCLLFGRDLVEGVVGFGYTLERAREDFDHNWDHGVSGVPTQDK